MQPTVEEIYEKLNKIEAIRNHSHIKIFHDGKGCVKTHDTASFILEEHVLFSFDNLTDFMQKADEYIKANGE